MGEEAWRWVLGQVEDEDGPWLPEQAPLEESPPARPGADRDSLYAGIAGLAFALAEVGLTRALADREESLATSIAERLARAAATRTEPCLYSGLAGDAAALQLLNPGGAQQVLGRLIDLAGAAGWPTTLDDLGPQTPVGSVVNDLVLGTAGIVLTGAWAGGETGAAVARIGADALLEAADETEAGLDWGLAPDYPSRMPNYSHGTAGAAAALAVAGLVLDDPYYVVAAARGAEHLLSLASLDGDGFTLPLIIPHGDRDFEPVTYSWCHGPTGTSYLFAALARAGVAEVGGYSTYELRARCLRSVASSGVPERLRPGFWDNDGRCCGTAGVGDAFLDAAQDEADPVRAEAHLGHAQRMGDALVARAIRDDTGARWRFVEHRQEPPLLPPNTTWMQGAAGISGFLHRLARVCEMGFSAPVVDRPDQWWAVPGGLRLVRTL